MAAVFCASFSRRAMVWRSRVIFTRSSRDASSPEDGARLACAGSAEGFTPFSRASITSPFSTWPRLPEPSTWLGDIWLSASILAADGDAGTPGLAAGGDCSSLAFSGAGAGAASFFFSSLAEAAGAETFPLPSPTVPSSAPTSTVSPSFATISPITPLAGAGTSTVTLSVSSSTSGSSALTASPGFLNHCPMVASVTDSPSVGTRISFAMSCRPFK